MKKELLEVAKKSGISSGVAEAFADKLSEEGYTLAKKPQSAQTQESQLKTQPKQETADNTKK